MAKKTGRGKVARRVNWNSRPLKIGDTFTVEYEITDLTSDGTSMSVVASPKNLPEGVSIGNVNFGAVPHDEDADSDDE